MDLVLMPEPKIQFFGNNGLPLAGGLLYTYKPGSYGIPKATYTDSTGGTYNTNPIALDYAGRASVWLDGYYAMKLTDVTGATIWTQDNVSVSGTSGVFTVLINAETGPQSVTIPSNQRDTVYIKTDNTDNTVTLLPATGYSFETGFNPIIYNQYESITVRVTDENYYEVSGNSVVPFFSISYSTATPTAAQIIELNALSADVETTLTEDNTEYIIIRTDTGSSFTATINAPVGYTIENTSTYALSLGGESVHLILAGTNYYGI